MGISFKSSTDFSKLRRFLDNTYHIINRTNFDKYGREGVEALKAMTPVDSGLTANSWYYRVEQKPGRVTIKWYNSNTNEGCNVAILLQYGHATGNGAYVQGRDYINPAIHPIFKEMSERIEKEVKGAL